MVEYLSTLLLLHDACVGHVYVEDAYWYVGLFTYHQASQVIG